MRSLPGPLRVALALFALTLPAAAVTINVPTLTTPTIQSGIDAASDGDIVVVASGTAAAPAIYLENIDFKGKAITVTSPPSSDPSSVAAAVTIIDGASNAPTVTFKSNESRTSVLNGFTIRNGGAAESSGSVFNYGGINVNNAAPTIQGNIITHNNCFGIVSTSSAPLISGNEISATQTPPGGCSFTNGSAIFIAATLPVDNSSAIVSGNTIENNVESTNSSTIQNGGAGISVYSGSPSILNNIIRNNAAPFATGGGIDVVGGSNVTIVQNLIYSNQAGCGGGAIAFRTEANAGLGLYLLVQNNTISGNTGPTAAPAAGCVQDSQLDPTDDGYSYPIVIFLNNIITGNTAAPATSCYQQQPNFEYNQSIFDHNILYNAGGSFFGQYCIDVSARYGNLAVDPLFKDPSNADFTLQTTPKFSPAIDAGNNSTTVFSPSYDFVGDARIQDATGKGYPVIDMGAYESPGQAETTPTTVAVTTSTPRAGRPLVITAVVSSPSGTPTGTAAFYIDSIDRTAPPVTLDSTGVATFSVTLPIGSHSIYAVYSGAGAAFPPSVSVVIVVDIEPVKTSVSIAANPNPALIAQNIVFTVTTSSVDPTYIPSPVNVYDTDHAYALLATVYPDPTTGVATFNDATLSGGLHTIVATFPGNPTYSTSTSAPLLLRITSPTTLTLASGTNPVQAGVSFTLTATITGQAHPPSGSINFFSDNVSIGTANIVNTAGAGLPTTLTVSLPGGTHNLVARYPGDDNSDSSVSNTVVETVLADPTTLTLSSAAPNPALAFQIVALSAHIAAANSTTPPTGEINFLANGTLIGSGAIDSSGNATLANGFSGGTYAITASYTANTSFAASTSAAITEVVNKDASSTSVTASPNPGYFPGGTVNLSTVVTVTLPTPHKTFGLPTGTYSFFDGGNLLATIPITSPPISISSFAVGSHTITAAYSGDSNYLPSTSAPITLNILLRDFSLTADPSITIQSQHHKALVATLTSVGGFTGDINLTCGNLPQFATCNFPAGGNQASVHLATDTLPIDIDIDTDALLNFASNSRIETSPRLRNAIAFALLSPVAFFVRRRRVRATGIFLALFALALATTLSGCSGQQPGHTPPGTYNITVTAQSPDLGLAHTATVTLIVTE